MTVGITGGIGSGKSTIARELAKRGYAVYDCDREAKRIIVENEAVRKAIIGLLGEEAFIKGQGDKRQGTKYNTEYVAKRVFEDPELLARLNAIVHPAVKEDISIQDSAFRVLFVESAILFEAGLDTLCDKVVVVEAPEEVRIAHTITRDYKGEVTEDHINKVRARIRVQEGTSHITSSVPCIRILNDGNTPIEELVHQIIQEI